MRTITKVGRLLSMSVALWAAALAGCEEATMVGSGCPNGVCPKALSRNDDACATSVVHAEIAITLAPGQPVGSVLATICLPSPLTRKDDGRVNARVYYFIPEQTDPPIHCTDKPFLRPVSAATREFHADYYPDMEMCELNQLAVIETDVGAPSVAAGSGFFYDDFTERPQVECTAPNTMINITASATPWNGVTAMLTTAETRNESGEIDPALVCDPHVGSEPVGTPCLPEQHVYNDAELVIQTRADACGDGVCIVYHLDGDTNPSCEPSEQFVHPCATPETIEERAYCSCRCDGPPGSADLCECPSGFACVDAVSTLEPELAGSYCVKDGSVAQ